jgi:type IV pilus assembly protein PilF
VNRLCWLLPVLLAACAPGSGSRNIREPVLQQQVVGETRTKAKNRVELGTAYYQDRQFGVALEETRKAIALDSGYAPAQNLLALIYMELGQKPEAQQAFERALRLAPGDPDISNNYGWFLCQNGEEKKSLGHFQTAIADPLYSTPGTALVNAAICSSRIKDDKAAEDYLLRALNGDPDNIRALYQLSELYFKMGRFADARQRISEYHGRVEPTAESTWLALRIARGQGNRRDEAAFMGALRRNFPNSPEYQKLQQGQFQ